MVTQSPNMYARAWGFVLLVACWTSERVPVTEPTKPTPPSTGEERRATVRIDAAPSGKKFQGVWLELARPDHRWVIDYRPRALWQPFADREVLVTGQCYRPFGQAIGATHFRVDRMRFVTPERGRGPILELGPEQRVRGAFAEHRFPPGSKLADAPRLVFVADGGERYWIEGAADPLPAADTAALITAREVVPDVTYSAQPDGPRLWILDVRAPDATDDPAHAPVLVPCP